MSENAIVEIEEAQTHVPASTGTAWSKISCRRTGLVVKKKLDFDEWEQVGTYMREMNRAIGFVLGDWLNWGEETYGEKYSQAFDGDSTEFEYQTLRNYAWVCAAIPMKRRRESLSFSHHMEVAACEPDQQDALLTQAEEEGWNTKELRRAVSDLRVSEGQKALPAAKFDEIKQVWENYGLPMPKVPNDGCLAPVAKAIRKLESNAIPIGHVPIRNEHISTLIERCKEYPFSDCDECEHKAECERANGDEV